jgi:phenylpropionate dioxygenase-like ring-hydroxylating dioxygenase large terminal subunit
MYINFWYVMDESKNVTQEKPVHVRRLGQDFVLFRDQQGVVHCLHDVCTHRGASLSHGRTKGDCVECPYHGWQFNGEGNVVKIPSLGPDGQDKIPGRTKIDSYPVQEQYGLIYAFLGDLPEEERPPLMVPHTNPTGIDYSGEEWRYVTQSWSVNTNYERAVENGVDPAHNEFVHARHGFMGARSEYKIPDYEVKSHPWGNGFMMMFYAPKSTDDVLQRKGGKQEEGDLEAGAGYNGPNQVWTYIHITSENWMHQYLYETPIDEHHTQAFNVNMVNFLPPDVAEDEEIMAMNAVIAEDDVIVLEQIRPITTPDNMLQEVMMPADRMIVAYRKDLKTWDAKGWRIDTDAVKATAGKKVYAIPSPRRRLEKGWVFDPIPLIPGADAAAAKKTG